MNIKKLEKVLRKGLNKHVDIVVKLHRVKTRVIFEGRIKAVFQGCVYLKLSNPKTIIPIVEIALKDIVDVTFY